MKHVGLKKTGRRHTPDPGSTKLHAPHCQRARNIERAVLLYGIDPARHVAARALARVVSEARADSGVIEWTDVDERELWFPHVSVGTPCAGFRVAIGSDGDDRWWAVRLPSEPRELPTDASLSIIWGFVSRLRPRQSSSPTPGAPPVDFVLSVLQEAAHHGWTYSEEMSVVVGRWLRRWSDELTDPAEAELVRQLATAVGGSELEAVGEALHRYGQLLHDAGQLECSAELHRLEYETAIARVDSGAGATAARMCGRSLRKIGRHGDALRWYDQAARLAQFDDDLTTWAIAIDGAARTHLHRGATPRARESIDEGLRIASASGDSYARGALLLTLGATERLAGDARASRVAYWRAARAFDSDRWKGHALVALGSALVDLGDLELADRAYRAALGKLPEDTERDTRVLALDALTYVAALRGDASRYDRRYAELEGLAGDVRPTYRVQLLFYRAKALAHLGRVGESRDVHAKTIAYARAHGFLQYSERSELELEAIPDPPGDAVTERIGAWLTALAETA